LRGRICLAALGFLPVTRRSEQDACFADGDPGSALYSHYVREFVLLIAACFGYLADSLTSLLIPSYEDVVGRIANIPLTLGEPAILLWLLIRGAKDQPLEAMA
jgi:hypothetical protein